MTIYLCLFPKNHENDKLTVFTKTGFSRSFDWLKIYTKSSIFKRNYLGLTYKINVKIHHLKKFFLSDVCDIYSKKVRVDKYVMCKGDGYSRLYGLSQV